MSELVVAAHAREGCARAPAALREQKYVCPDLESCLKQMKAARTDTEKMAGIMLVKKRATVFEAKVPHLLDHNCGA